MDLSNIADEQALTAFTSCGRHPPARSCEGAQGKQGAGESGEGSEGSKGEVDGRGIAARRGAERLRVPSTARTTRASLPDFPRTPPGC